jgi:hypothetical protein
MCQQTSVVVDPGKRPGRFSESVNSVLCVSSLTSFLSFKLRSSVAVSWQRKNPSPSLFPYPYFIVKNEIRSERVGNENRSGINGISKTDRNRNTSENS